MLISPNEFKPRVSNAKEFGFVETGHELRFNEACAALQVSPCSAPEMGYGKRSYGAQVMDSGGDSYWLKVFGLISADNERWKAETEADAITMIGKPQLIRQVNWKHNREVWVARLTTFVTGFIERGPWSDAGAKAVTDNWIEILTQFIEILARQKCARVHVQPKIFKRWLWRHFRRDLKIEPSDWIPSHNDLQWSNISHPDLSIIDWEWYGRSPRGYDQGTLIAYSCHDKRLIVRLENAFKSSLDGEIAAYGKIFAAHTIRNSIQSGWLSPSMRASVEELIVRWEAEVR